MVDRAARRQEGRPGGEGGGRAVGVQRGPEAGVWCKPAGTTISRAVGQTGMSGLTWELRAERAVGGYWGPIPRAFHIHFIPDDPAAAPQIVLSLLVLRYFGSNVYLKQVNYFLFPFSVYI